MKQVSFSIDIEVNESDFSLEQTLECGQCFRFYKIGNNEYVVIAQNTYIRVEQRGNILKLFCTQEEYERIWKIFFDLDRDYGKIKELLKEKDPFLKEAIMQKHGVHILKQEPFEMLLSFILSQNKQIPHIKKLIEGISSKYGNYLGECEGISCYSFPTLKQLKAVTEEEFRQLKTGFRAPYLVDAIKQIDQGIILLDSLYGVSYLEAKQCLMGVRGVGEKIADCVLLYAYGRYEVFPTDVWVKRVVEHYYFDEPQKMDKIQEFAKYYFGDYAGFAQQYLFYYARDNKIGK